MPTHNKQYKRGPYSRESAGFFKLIVYFRCRGLAGDVNLVSFGNLILLESAFFSSSNEQDATTTDQVEAKLILQKDGILSSYSYWIGNGYPTRKCSSPVGKVAPGDAP